jgi:HK97 family phage major capsid protein
MSEIIKQIQEIQEEVTKSNREGKSLIEEVKKQAEQLAEKGATKEEISQLKTAYDAQIKALTDYQDELATKLKKAGTMSDNQKSFGDLVEDQLTAKEADLKALKQSKGQGGVHFDVKAVGTNLLANYNGGTGIALTTWDNEIARTPRVNPFMRQIVNTRGINSLLVAWAEFTGGEGGADMVVEGARKPQKDFDYVEASSKVEKIAVFTKASKEALDDIRQLRAEINSELVFEVEKKLDQQILSGTGVSPELKGINTYAAALNVTGLPFATGVDAPNRADVLMVAAAVIANNGFDANYAVINPLDAAMMQLTKDANGNYVLPPFSSANGAQVAGMRIVANRGVAAGSFLVGDFSKDILAIREEINIQIGYENDDFTRNLITILAEMRAVNYIKAQYIPAFVKGTFSTALTAIGAV